MKFTLFVLAISTIGLSTLTTNTFAQDKVEMQQQGIEFDINTLKKLRAEYEITQPDNEKLMLAEIVRVTEQGLIANKMNIEELHKANASENEIKAAHEKLNILEQLHTGIVKSAELPNAKNDIIKMLDEYINQAIVTPIDVKQITPAK